MWLKESYKVNEFFVFIISNLILKNSRMKPIHYWPFPSPPSTSPWSVWHIFLTFPQSMQHYLACLVCAHSPEGWGGWPGPLQDKGFCLQWRAPSMSHHMTTTQIRPHGKRITVRACWCVQTATVWWVSFVGENLGFMGKIFCFANFKNSVVND